MIIVHDILLETVDLDIYNMYPNKSLLFKYLSVIHPKILFVSVAHYHRIKSLNPDVSVSFLNGENISNMIACKLLKKPCVISIRNNIVYESEIESIFEKIFLLIQRILIWNVKPYIITNSEDNKNWFVTNWHIQNKKCISIYNPKDIANIRSLSQHPLEDSFFNTNEPIILTVGRLSPQKGQIHLIRVFSHLCKTISCRLVICGVGVLENELKKLARDLSVEKSILFVGWSDNPYKYMKRADVFVFSSLFEGQPNSLIEALICGCPIVSTDCDYGPREILNNGKYGLLTKKLDGKISDPVNMSLTNAELDMYEKVLYLLQNPNEREVFRQLSIEQAKLFDRDICVNKYYSVFRAAADGRNIDDI